MVKIKGTEIELGGTTYVVPPLNLAQVEYFQERLQGYTGGLDPESIKLAGEVVFAALSRNYPDITIEQVKEVLDLGNMHDVFSAVLNVSGFVAKADAAGEAIAPAK